MAVVRKSWYTERTGHIAEHKGCAAISDLSLSWYCHVAQTGLDLTVFLPHPS